MAQDRKSSQQANDVGHRGLQGLRQRPFSGWNMPQLIATNQAVKRRRSLRRGRDRALEGSERTAQLREVEPFYGSKRISWRIRSGHLRISRGGDFSFEPGPRLVNLWKSANGQRNANVDRPPTRP
jgi:hypothetical protein